MKEEAKPVEKKIETKEVKIEVKKDESKIVVIEETKKEESKAPADLSTQEPDDTRLTAF